MSDQVFKVVVRLVVTLVVWGGVILILGHTWRIKSPARQDVMVLRPSRGGLYLSSVVLLLAPVSFGLLALVFPEVRFPRPEFFVTAGFVLACAAYGVFSLVTALRVCLIVSVHGLVYRPRLGRAVHMRWSKIQHVRYRSFAGALVVSGTGPSITIGTMLQGFPGALEAIRRHVPQAVHADALAALEKNLSFLR